MVFQKRQNRGSEGNSFLWYLLWWNEFLWYLVSQNMWNSWRMFCIIVTWFTCSNDFPIRYKMTSKMKNLVKYYIWSSTILKGNTQNSQSPNHSLWGSLWFSISFRLFERQSISLYWKLYIKNQERKVSWFMVTFNIESLWLDLSSTWCLHAWYEWWTAVFTNVVLPVIFT